MKGWVLFLSLVSCSSSQFSRTPANFGSDQLSRNELDLISRIDPVVTTLEYRFNEGGPGSFFTETSAFEVFRGSDLFLGRASSVDETFNDDVRRTGSNIKHHFVINNTVLPRDMVMDRVVLHANSETPLVSIEISYLLENPRVSTVQRTRYIDCDEEQQATFDQRREREDWEETGLLGRALYRMNLRDYRRSYDTCSARQEYEVERTIRGVKFEFSGEAIAQASILRFDQSSMETSLIGLAPPLGGFNFGDYYRELMQEIKDKNL